jgi:hypothetical protein
MLLLKNLTRNSSLQYRNKELLEENKILLKEVQILKKLMYGIELKCTKLVYKKCI